MELIGGDVAGDWWSKFVKWLREREMRWLFALEASCERWRLLATERPHEKKTPPVMERLPAMWRLSAIERQRAMWRLQSSKQRGKTDDSMLKPSVEEGSASIDGQFMPEEWHSVLSRCKTSVSQWKKLTGKGKPWRRCPRILITRNPQPRICSSRALGGKFLQFRLVLP